MIPKWISALLISLLLIAPAFATTITAENVGSYSIAATPGNVFYKIKVGDLPIGTNQTHTLIYNGNSYLLTINTWTEYGIMRHAQISLTMPNGTVQTSESVASTIAGSYSTIIQPTMRADSSVLESGTVMFLTVDLNIGLTPASAQFSTAPMGYAPQSSLPFTAASGSFSNAQITDVYVYQVTTQDFIDTIQTYNPSAGLGDLGSAVFQWTWTGVLGFLNMIPVIGPIAISFLEMAGYVITELWYWLVFVFENLPAIILAVESLIIMMAVINAGKGSRAMGKMVSNVVNYNIAFAVGTIHFFEMVREWIVRLIEFCSSIIQALKPI